MMVYLDTCVWCRPFDRPTQRVTEEARALHGILDLADKGKIQIISSSLVLFETSFIEPIEKRESVVALIHRSSAQIAGATEAIEGVTQKLQDECGLDPMDAAHVAMAINEGIDIFLITDDGIVNKSECISKYGIIVKNPVDFEVKR